MSDLYRDVTPAGEFSPRGAWVHDLVEMELLVPVEPVETNEVWWCKTHGIGQHYDGEGPWWNDEWAVYTCAIKAEYPIEGKCVPLRVLIVEADYEQ